MKANQKKQRIIEATAALFLQQGVRKTAMEDIAAHARVSKVTVYKYFGDKDGILNAVCCWLTERCLQTLVAQTEAGLDTAACLISFTQVLSDFIRSGEQALCSQLGAITNLSAAHYAAFEERVKAMIFALIRESKDAHLIEKGLGDEVIYHYIEMGLCYYKENTLYRERMWVDANFRKAFLHLIWRNIFNSEALQKIETW